MVAFGDDFGFQNAKGVFDKWDEVQSNILEIANTKSMKAQMKYSNLNTFFQDSCKP